MYFTYTLNLYKHILLKKWKLNSWTDDADKCGMPWKQLLAVIYELVVHTQYLLDRYIYTRIKKQVELNVFIDNIHNNCIYVRILIAVKLD